jgi:hypothetical protein
LLRLVGLGGRFLRRSRGPGGKVETGALLAAEVVAGPQGRFALGQIALTLRVQDHLFRARAAMASVSMAPSLARQQIELEQGEKEIKKEEKKYEPQHEIGLRCSFSIPSGERQDRV